MMRRRDPAEDPTREPMPVGIVPMLAKLGILPPDDDRWGYEIKWDGERAILYCDGGRIRLESRNLLDITSQYPELHALGRELGSRTAVLDGEIVVLDDEGRPSFQRLQSRMHVSSPPARLVESNPVIYMIFDVLYLEGHVTMGRTYAERRNVLAGLGLTGTSWQTPGHSVGGGPALLEAARAKGLEGLVAKRLDSTYQPGKRPGSWIKVKRQNRQEFVVGGWAPGAGRREGGLGALIIGYYDGGEFVYAGKVGTGFAQKDLEHLARLLEPLETSVNPFTRGTPPKHTRFVEPRLVGEVEFTEWTGDGTLRHPSWKGLRRDKDPRQVVREG